MTADDVRTRIEMDGYVIMPDILDPRFVARARQELAHAIDVDSRRYGPRAERDYGMVMLCALHGGSFLDLFENDRLLAPFNAVLGDVSTHGFPAALIMALVLSAAGIHAAAADSPERALERLLESVEAELDTTEMFLTVFYGVVDSERRIVRYANAGLPHAFLVPPSGDPIRLEATAPPLGLGEGGSMVGAEQEVGSGTHHLVLFSDGIAETALGGGVVFGEQRVLSTVREMRNEPSEQIVETVFERVGRFPSPTGDDQALLVLKI